MIRPQFADISGYQENIDWDMYRRWAAQWDGKARIAIKATEGVGFKDGRFESHRARGTGNCDQIIYYHYGRPDLGNTPQDEAKWFKQVVGEIRPQDKLYLDIEANWKGNVSEWSFQFLSAIPSCGLYSYSSYIRERLQDSRLAQFQLWYALWSHNPEHVPLAPAPWGSYQCLQWSDKASIPGIDGMVDCNIWIGDKTRGIPTGWRDDGKTLTAPNGNKVVHGFREWVLSHEWDSTNVPLENEQVHKPNLTRQCFESSVLWYTKEQGVFQERHLGKELYAAYNALATAKAQLPMTDMATIASIANKYMLK